MVSLKFKLKLKIGIRILKFGLFFLQPPPPVTRRSSSREDGSLVRTSPDTVTSNDSGLVEELTAEDEDSNINVRNIARFWEEEAK